MKSAKFLGFSELRGRGIPLGRRQLDRLEAAGKFPRRVHISERRVGWVAEEIEAHVADKVANRCARIGST
ncbi:helix-turn-helix transcriptional regulator [Bradyrhizobium erythrophlei]|uniref:Prophage CP4-57 regulatory protein (AlpA) n=1 Tax=Bradyrhizobium erythrophlei TaxID=1437360 RepID=A0A1M5GXK0_9BRAD|nr:AlpA family phage regulatory protein [Bradyrhizobium erythrophlei]SHG08408.1 Prophage CP4-57 regulatory protein (AlpA) [Bradyrhizobium erythrophlei]